MTERQKRWLIFGAVFVLTAAFYSATFTLRDITDTDVNALQTRSFVLHGDVDLMRYHDLVPAGAFVRDRDNKSYSIYGVSISIFAAPISVWLERLHPSEALRQGSISVTYSALAATVMFALLIRLFDRKLAVAGTIAYAFATPMWPLASMAMYLHSVVAPIQILGIAAVFSKHERSPLWAGLAFGAAATLRPAQGIALIVFGLYFLITDRKAAVRYAVGATGPIVFLLVQNRWLWGSWFQSGYSFAGPGFHGDVLPDLWRLTFGWWRGVFVYSPVLLVALVGGRAKDKRVLALTVSTIATILLYARFTTWWGGLSQFGNRYLLDVTPPLIVLGALAVTRFPGLRKPALGLGVLSLITMAFGSVPRKWAFDFILFPREFSASPFGQAWTVGIQHPVGPLLRLAGIAVVGAALFALASRLPRSGTGATTGPML